MAAVPEAVLKKAAEDKLEKLLKDFETANDSATQTPGKTLRELIDKAPVLKERLVESVRLGQLEKIDALAPGTHAGGTYSTDTRTISLPVDQLNSARTHKGAAADLTYVIGHEIQHSFNTDADKAMDAFIRDAGRIAGTPGPHDYTAAVKTVIQANRDDEATANIGGYNALLSQVRKDNPAAGLKELYNAAPGRMDDFVERAGRAPAFTYALKPGLTLEADMHMRTTPENVKAMGKYYFDQPPSVSRLGARGNQDYPNYYGEWAVNVIKDKEAQALADARRADPAAAAPEVRINLREIGLDRTLLDTGLTYTDTSPRRPVTVDHAATHAAASPLYAQAITALERVQGPAGLGDRDQLLNAAAATAVQAQKAGMERIDGALVGRNGQVFAFQGDPSSEHADRIAVDVSTARQVPAAQSLANMAADAPAPPAPAPRGPSL